MARSIGWNDLIRKAIRDSGMSLYAVAQAAELNVAPIQRFMAGEHGMTIDSAERVCGVVGLTLRPMRKGGQ